MRKGLHLFLITINVAVLLLCGLGLFLFTLNLLVRQAQYHGYSDIDQIYSDLRQSYENNGKIDYQAAVLSQSHLIPARIVIVDGDSNLLADSRDGGDLIPGKHISAVIIDAKEQQYAGSTLRGLKKGELSVSAARKMTLPTGEIIISLTYRIDDERRLLLVFALFILGLLLLLATLVFAVISYILKRYRSPIRKLLHYTREAARGGFNKISIESSDKALNQLAEEFNSLVDLYNYLVETDNRKYSRINTLLSNLRTGILMLDGDGEVTLVNPEAEKLLNLNKLSLFNIRGAKGRGNDVLNEILDKARDLREAGKSGVFKMHLESGLILDIAVEVMRNKYAPYESTGNLIILRDVTEMWRLEKLKDEFVANVSHELRTPLTVISGFVETLKSNEQLDREDRTTALNIIEVETERLKKLIGELLLLSRIEGEMGHARKRPIDTAAAVEQVRTTLGHMAEKKNIQTHIETEEGLKPIFGVAGWFRQIVYNLYGNAIKYTPDGGSITIRLGSRDGSISLEVEDTGIGIPVEEQERIFERFYRRDAWPNSPASGSGIGLTITRHMVSEFGGTITVSSREGQGSVFRVILPQQ